MRKTLGLWLVLTLAQSFSACHAAPQFSQAQLVSAYSYAYKLYGIHRFDDAKELFKKIAMVSTNPGLNANSLYYYSQCSFRTQDYDGCVKALDMLVQRWPNSTPVAQGYVFKFCYFVINQAAQIQDKWDYFRYPEGKDETGAVIWKESVPPGYRARRINFRLAFGLFRVLNRIYANAPQTAQCKAKLIKMINTPLTIRWIDEKAPPNRWFHPTDFVSIFSPTEKKDFSKFICDRMFYNWKTEKLYLFLDMWDDIRNLKPRFYAITKNLEEVDEATQAASPLTGGGSHAVDPQDQFFTLTLSKLFQISGYNPYSDSTTSITDADSTNMNL